MGKRMLIFLEIGKWQDYLYLLPGHQFLGTPEQMTSKLVQLFFYIHISYLD